MALMPAGKRYTVPGTDGFGRSDTRAGLRSHFEVDRHWIAHAALDELLQDGLADAGEMERASALYGLDPDQPEPWKT